MQTTVATIKHVKQPIMLDNMPRQSVLETTCLTTCLAICNARDNLLINLYKLYSNLQRCRWHPGWQLPSCRWRPARQQYSEQEMVLDSPRVGIPPFSSSCTGWYTHTPLNLTLLHYKRVLKSSGGNSTVLWFYWLYACPSQSDSPTLQEFWSHQVGIPPFSGFTGCTHAPLNLTLLHCKSLEVIRWESLPFCCCTGTCIPLSTLLSYMTKSVFESDSRNPRIPLSSLVRYSTGQQTFGDNRVHPFVTVVVHISLSLSLNFTLLQDQSCGQFQVGTPPLSLL